MQIKKGQNVSNKYAYFIKEKMKMMSMFELGFLKNFIFDKIYSF